MKLLICAATSLELKAIKPQVRDARIPSLDVQFLTTGIGNYETIYALTQYLEIHDKPNLILNFGICGYVNDSDFEPLVQMGRVLNFHTKKERVLPIHLKDIPVGTITSSEIPTTSSKGIEQYVDMESWGICLVCEKYNISRIILKVPYDKIGEETKNFDTSECEKKLQTVDLSEVLENLRNLKLF